VFRDIRSREYSHQSTTAAHFLPIPGLAINVDLTELFLGAG
jgi:hypothetical protein